MLPDPLGGVELHIHDGDATAGRIRCRREHSLLEAIEHGATGTSAPGSEDTRCIAGGPHPHSCRRHAYYSSAGGRSGIMPEGIGAASRPVRDLLAADQLSDRTEGNRAAADHADALP